MPKPGGMAAFVKCLPIAHFWGFWCGQLAIPRRAVSLTLGGRAGEHWPTYKDRAREGCRDSDGMRFGWYAIRMVCDSDGMRFG